MHAWGNFAISYLAINGAISYSAIAYAVDIHIYTYIYIYIVVGYLKQSNGWFCLTVNILVTCRDITTMSLEIVLIRGRYPKAALLQSRIFRCIQPVSRPPRLILIPSNFTTHDMSRMIFRPKSKACLTGFNGWFFL